MKLLVIASALLLTTAIGRAQSGDWPRLRSLRHGTMLVIETNVNAYGPADFSRCRLLRVDADTLTCMALDGKTRLTFAADRLDAVYKVKRAWVKPVLAAVAVGGFIGGLATANGPVFALGVLAGIIWGIMSVHDNLGAMHGATISHLPNGERGELIYLRP